MVAVEISFVSGIVPFLHMYIVHFLVLNFVGVLVLSTFAAVCYFSTKADMPKIARVPKSQRLTFDDKQAWTFQMHGEGSLDDHVFGRTKLVIGILTFITIVMWMTSRHTMK